MQALSLLLVSFLGSMSTLSSAVSRREGLLSLQADRVQFVGRSTPFFVYLVVVGGSLGSRLQWCSSFHH